MNEMRELKDFYCTIIEDIWLTGRENMEQEEAIAREKEG